MTSGEIPGDGETDAGTAHPVGQGAGDAEEGVEDPFARSLGNTRTVVGDAYRRRIRSLVACDCQPFSRGAVLLHVADEIAEDPRSVILEQVTNGVAVRMAVLYLLAGSTRPPKGGRSKR